MVGLTWSEVADALWLAAAGGTRSSPQDGDDDVGDRQLPPPAPQTKRAQSGSEAHGPDGPRADGRAQDGSDTGFGTGPDATSTMRPAAGRTAQPEPEPEPGRPAGGQAAIAADGSGQVGSGPQAGSWSHLDHDDAQESATSRAGPPSLPSELPIIRALRPLKRMIPSWREEDVVLDEEGTAERAAEDGLWLPVTRSGETRWLDLTLIIDADLSMALWRPAVAAFVALMERLGTFRAIQTRLLDVRRAGGQPVPVLRGGTRQAPARSAAEVIDPSGRRLVLVLTDGLGPVWQGEAMSNMLAEWGRVMPTAVLHMLPQRMWSRTWPALHRARLTARSPVTPNSKWTVDWPDAWLDQDADTAPSGAVPVPILELGRRWLGWWARLVAGEHRGPAYATVLLAGDGTWAAQPKWDGASAVGPEPGNGQSGPELVRQFRSRAAPAAVRLATLLATVPVSLPIARFVQREFVPDSDRSHLAEVLSSGLLHPVVPPGGPDVAAPAVEAITFEFRDGARAALLQGGRRSETAAVVRSVARMSGSSALSRFSEALAAPDTTPDPDVTAAGAAQATMERVVLHALSGPYLSRAGRVSDSLRGGGLSSIPTAPLLPSSPTATTISDRENTMNDAGTSIGVSAYRADEERSHTPAAEERPPDAAGAASAASLRARGPAFGLTVPRERPGEDIPTIWGNVPPRNPNFTGREQFLDELHQRLAAGGTTAVLPAALHGMGGIGKTQIATEYIYRHLRDYDLIWWIQAAQPAQIRASMTELAQRLHLPGSAEANTAVPVVREALRIGDPVGNWLLVFDSAENLETVRQFFPTNGPGQILITSRNPDWVGIARPLELDVFRRSESVDLLRRRGPEMADQDADRLGEKLGDLPLAIEQAAAWCSETGMPVQQYLHLFDEKVAEILDTSAPADYEVSVAAAWNVSFDELSKRNPAAHQLLQVCAFFSPEPIARSIFSGVRGISIAPELDAALRDPMQLSRAIRDINRYGLAKIDHRHDTLQLHRLVQLVLRNRMTPQHRADMRHGAHLLLANLDPNDPVPATQWPRYQDVLPHAYASEVVACEDRWVGQLVLNLMTFLYYWGDHEEAGRLAKLAVDNWTASRGEDDPQVLRAATSLGYYLWELGRYPEAAEVNQRTLDVYRRISGDSSEETLIAQNSVAGDLKAKGDFPGARDLSEEIYQKAKGIFGEDDPSTLATAHNLAVNLRLTGEYQRAWQLDEDTYRRRADALGYDNSDTISTLNGLILDRRELGDYSWARAEQETVVERVRVLFGEDKALTLRRLFHLSVARRKDGDHDGALELSGEALRRFRLRYGEEHPYAMACALGHSIDLRHTSDLDASRDLGEQTFERYRKSLGERHPHTLSAAVDQAVTLRHLGNPQAARQLTERSLEQLRSLLGPDHPHAIVCAVNLGSDLAASGDAEAALAVDEEAAERALSTLGADHPTTLAADVNLMLDLRSAGRTQEAEARFADIVARYRRVLGEKHPATIAAAGGVRADCDIDPLPL